MSTARRAPRHRPRWLRGPRGRSLVPPAVRRHRSRRPHGCWAATTSTQRLNPLQGCPTSAPTCGNGAVLPVLLDMNLGCRPPV